MVIINQAAQVSWLTHKFSVYLPDVNWNNVAGIYIFSGLNQQNKWVPLYIGQAKSFQDRLPSHEQWIPARKLGATHVHAMAVLQQSQRDSIEKQLIQAFQPTLNMQLK